MNGIRPRSSIGFRREVAQTVGVHLARTAGQSAFGLGARTFSEAQLSRSGTHSAVRPTRAWSRIVRRHVWELGEAMKQLWLSLGVVAALAAWIGLAPSVRAQATGVIAGTVSGPNGPIAGLTVNIVNGAGSVVGTAVTTQTGTYTVGNLAAGTYTIQVVNAAGRVVVTGVGTVTAAALTATVNLTLTASQLAPAAVAAGGRGYEHYDESRTRSRGGRGGRHPGVWSRPETIPARRGEVDVGARARLHHGGRSVSLWLGPRARAFAPGRGRVGPRWTCLKRMTDSSPDLPPRSHFNADPPAPRHAFAGFAEPAEPDIIRTYLAVIYRRRWVALGMFAVVFVLALVRTFSETPIYEATAEMLIDADSPNIVSFDDVMQTNRRALDYFQTQYRLLTSRSLVKQALEESNLIADPAFADPEGSATAAPAATAADPLSAMQGQDRRVPASSRQTRARSGASWPGSPSRPSGTAAWSTSRSRRRARPSRSGARTPSSPPISGRPPICGRARRRMRHRF